MKLLLNQAHIWSVDLGNLPESNLAQLAYLNSLEQERADRLQHPVHRQRFIAARYALRKIISHYLNTNPTSVHFGYNQHGKPYLLNDNRSLQFNLTHSQDIALYAITLDHQIGIDIEKMGERDHAHIAERFFSAEENLALAKLPIDEQFTSFYRIWSRKEALIKAVGKGMFVPLTSFSVSPLAITETIHLEGKTWTLLSLDTLPGYQAALASEQPKEIIRMAFTSLLP